MGSPSYYQFRYHNFGNSPALNVRSAAKLYPPTRVIDFNGLQNEINEYNLDASTSFTIFNGQEIPIAHPSKTAMTLEQKEGINQEKLWVVLGSKVIYTDIFGDSHVSTFCIMYSPGKFGRPDGWIGCPTKQIAT